MTFKAFSFISSSCLWIDSYVGAPEDVVLVVGAVVAIIDFNI